MQILSLRIGDEPVFIYSPCHLQAKKIDDISTIFLLDVFFSCKQIKKNLTRKSYEYHSISLFSAITVIVRYQVQFA